MRDITPRDSALGSCERLLPAELVHLDHAQPHIVQHLQMCYGRHWLHCVLREVLGQTCMVLLMYHWLVRSGWR